MNASCLIRMSHVSYEWVMSHKNESCLILTSHENITRMSPLKDSWDMTRSCATWPVHMRHDSFIWGMTRSYEALVIHECHECLNRKMRKTWLVHVQRDSSIWDMTHPYGTWLVHARHYLFTNVTNVSIERFVRRSTDTREWIMSHVWMSHVL